MKFDVTIDRDLYLGGSDIPIIMGISPFKTRWELLQEKAGLAKSDFDGNQYTEYGDTMEPKIRDYVNELKKTKFVPAQVIKDDLRGNTDGFNGHCILEIKTTSHICEKVSEYKNYLVQLLFYMFLYKADKGLLAVYARPDDFSEEFDKERLKIHEIYMKDYQSLMEEIMEAIEKFRVDLDRLRENPLLTEQDFQPIELIAIYNRVEELEEKLAELKRIEEEQKKAKQELFEAMTNYGVKSWETPNGIKITRVDAIEETVETVTEFDEKTFKDENEGLYAMYLHEVEKKKLGKSGYVKVTLPKKIGG